MDAPAKRDRAKTASKPKRRAATTPQPGACPKTLNHPDALKQTTALGIARQETTTSTAKYLPISIATQTSLAQ